MSLHLLEARIVCAFALICAIAAPSAAQSSAAQSSGTALKRAAGPFAGLFGGGQSDDRTLDIRGTLSGAYDWGPSAPQGPASLADPANLIDPVLSETGVVRSMTGLINYDRQWTRTRFGLSGEGAYDQYPASVLRGGTYSASTNLSVDVTRRLALDARGGYTRSAFYQFAPSLGADPISTVPLTPGYDFAAVAQPNTTLDGALSLTSQYTKRSSLSGGIRSTSTRFAGAGAIDNFREWAADASFEHHITRPLSLRVGYERDQLLEGGPTAAPVVIQSLDVGFDYAEELTFARRTTLSFNASPAIVTYAGQREYRLNGTARLTRALARTWSTGIEYNRETSFFPGFDRPLFFDAVEASLGGLIKPRVEWSGTAEFSRGQIGSTASDAFGVYSVTSMLEVALGRNLALFSQYSYYRYRVPPGSTDLALLEAFSRHAVTVGLTAWLPLLNRRGNR